MPIILYQHLYGRLLIPLPIGYNYEILPMQYTYNFFSSKNLKFCWKMFDVLNIFAQNIDCGDMLEPPTQEGSNEYQ